MDKKQVQKSYVIGNTYYHYANPAEELEENFKRMRQYGVNTVRTNEIWPGWSVIETREGEYSWEYLDDYLDKAEKNGLDVCLGIGINDTPAWLYRKFPELRFKEYDGTVSNRRVQSADFNHMEYRFYMRRFIEALLKRYADHSCITCFQFGNEIRYNVTYCDSEGTRTRFRKWLQDKYGTPEKLNQEWGTFYASFDEIYPYKSREGEPTEGNTVHCVNTIEFQDWSIAELIDWGVRIVKSYSKKPVFHNNFNTPEHNHWAMARPCDLVCIDIYASTYEKPGYYNGLLIDTAASIARQQDKPWWIGETSIGQYGTYRRKNASQMLIETCIMEQIGAGSKAIFYFRHKSPKWEQPHKFTGSQTVYRRNGTPLPYIDTCIHVMDFVKQFERMLLEAEPPRPQVGIYFPCKNIQFGREAGYGELALESAGGARAFWGSIGVTAELLSDTEMTADYLKQFKLVHIPACYLLPERIGDALEKYVKAGGKLLVEARAAYVDENGLLYEQQPGAGLNRLCGVNEDLFYEAEEPITFRFGDSSVDTASGGLIQTLEPDGGVPIAFDSDGHVLGTARTWGEGEAFYLGFAPSLDFRIGGGKYSSEAGYKEKEDQRRQKMKIAHILAGHWGINFQTAYKGEDPDMSVRCLGWNNSRYLFFMNYGQNKVSLEFSEEASVLSDGEFQKITGPLCLAPVSWKMVKVPDIG